MVIRVGVWFWEGRGYWCWKVELKIRMRRVVFLLLRAVIGNKKTVLEMIRTRTRTKISIMPSTPLALLHHPPPTRTPSQKILMARTTIGKNQMTI